MWKLPQMMVPVSLFAMECLILKLNSVQLILLIHFDDRDEEGYINGCYGADAVYLGGDMFGARAYAGNLNQEEMFEALDYAHKLDRHIYLTVNTLLKQNEIEGQLIDYIAPFYERGLMLS